MQVAVIGAGWAGMAAAVRVTESGHNATIFEASRSIGGRARGISEKLPNGSQVMLDNGQHILIGAYTETLRLMRLVGLNPEDILLRLPLTLKFPDGQGLEFGRQRAPLDALAGILGATGWGWRDKAALLLASVGWRLRGFTCDPSHTVAQVCKKLPARLMAELIEPLCVSALNTPAGQASGQVFLRVMQDALFGAQGHSDLLLPRVDLSNLFPLAAERWMAQNSAQAGGGRVSLGHRIHTVYPDKPTGGWIVDLETYDAVILATSSDEAVRCLTNIKPHAVEKIANDVSHWVGTASALRHETITTVYAWGEGATLPRPMLALHSDTGKSAPAQFVFDRGQLGGPPGLLAFVVSASTGERDALRAQVLQQAHDQLGLTLQSVQTIREKSATFACTPALKRPSARVCAGLFACGDYVEGPYPATLEGAVRSGIEAADAATKNASKPEPEPEPGPEPEPDPDRWQGHPG
jgi:hydroxysqualene dehydroxylase